MNSIYCYGDVMYEQHLYLKEDNLQSDSTLVNVKNKIGGSSFNTANKIAQLGHYVNLISSIGKDSEGEFIKKYINSQKNISSKYLDYTPNETSKVFAIINKNNDHKFLSYRNNNQNHSDIIKKIKFQKDDIICISGYSFQNKDNLITINNIINESKKKIVFTFY